MSTDLGLLVLRIVIGLLIAGHGAQKLFGWFGGYGYTGTRGFMGGMLRLRPAGLWTSLAIATELGGGLLFAAGLFHPLGALALIASMLSALILAHWPRFWVTENGIEYPLVLATAGLAEGIAGSGAYALDRIFGTTLPAPVTLIVGLIAVVLGTIAMLATRAPSAVPAVGTVEETVPARAA